MGNVMATYERSSVVDDKLNVPLEDAELLAEVELTTNLIIAASESEEPLTVEEIVSAKGIKAWLVEDYTVPIVTVAVSFRGGSVQDPPGKEGFTDSLGDGGSDTFSTETGFEFEVEMIARGIALGFDYSEH